MCRVIHSVADLFFKEIDIAPYFFLQSAERNEIVDFLDGLFHEYKLMVTHPELDMDELPISAVAKPFQLTVKSINEFHHQQLRL